MTLYRHARYPNKKILKVIRASNISINPGGISKRALNIHNNDNVITNIVNWRT